MKLSTIFSVATTLLVTLVAAQNTESRNLTIPSTTTPTPPLTSGNVTVNGTIVGGGGNSTIVGGGNSTIGVNGTLNGTNSTLSSAQPSSSSTSISISTTLQETKGVTGTAVPNPFASGSTGGNSQNPDDGYVASSAKLVVEYLPLILTACIGILGTWIIM